MGELEASEQGTKVGLGFCLRCWCRCRSAWCRISLLLLLLLLLPPLLLLLLLLPLPALPFPRSLSSGEEWRSADASTPIPFVELHVDEAEEGGDDDDDEDDEEDVGEDTLATSEPVSCSSKRRCKLLMYSTAILNVSTLDSFLLPALDPPWVPAVLPPNAWATLCGMCCLNVANPLFTCLTRFRSRAFRLATEAG